MAGTACKFEKFTEACKKIYYLLLVFLSAIFNRAYTCILLQYQTRGFQ